MFWPRQAARRDTKLSFFYVPINDTKASRQPCLKRWVVDGMSTGGFTMKDVRIPAENLLGEENKGFYYAMEGFDYARAIIAAVCTGAAMAALEDRHRVHQTEKGIWSTYRTI